MEEELVEDAHIQQVRVFECLDNNMADKNGLGPLFIFMFRKRTFKGTPTGSNSNGTEELSGRRFVQACMRPEESIKDVFAGTRFFLYTETVEKVARELGTYLDSRFVFEETSFECMVFVVDVEATYASEDYVKAQETLLDSTNRDCDRDRDHMNVNCGSATDDGNYIESSLKVDDNKEYNLISLAGATKDVDDRMYVDVDMDDLDVYIDGVEDGDDYGYEDEDEDEEEEYMNDIIKCVKRWQRVGENPLLEEVQSKIKIECLDCRWNGSDMMITEEGLKHGECAICLASYPGRMPRNALFRWLPENHSCELVWLGCGHGFHYHCIFHWLDKNRSCPLCRALSYVDLRFNL